MGGGWGALVLERPLFRGTQMLNVTPPTADPIFNYRILSNPLDLALLIEFVKFGRRYFDSPRHGCPQPRRDGTWAKR